MRNGYETLIQTVRGNYGFSLPFTLQDSAGVAVDLTNATLQFEAQLESDSTVKFNGAMIVDSAIAGTCHYVVGANDFVVAGVWNVQLIATYAGEVLTFTGISVNVDAQLPI